MDPKSAKMETEKEVLNPSTSSPASTDTIEVDKTPRGTKRQIVDPKCNRVEPDEDEKTDILLLILHWHDYKINKFEMRYFIEIDTIADIIPYFYGQYTQN